MANLVYVDNSQLHRAAMQILESMDFLAQGRLDYAYLIQRISPTAPKAARLYGSKGYGKQLWNDATEAGFQATAFVRSCNNKEKEVTCALVTDLVADAITVAEPGDHFFVVAGDRDYLPAIQRVRKLGFPVTVLFFESHVDEKLAHAATHFVGLEADFPHLCKPVHSNHAADVFAEANEPHDELADA